jgi:hypothetical protein
MPRRPRSRGHPRPAAAPRAPHGRPLLDPAARLRALVEDGIIAAAAMRALDDLGRAAASTHRLGTLTAGTWRALSGELAAAAERLGRSTLERLDELHRRAQPLQVEPAAVIAAGMAAAHLDEHRATLDSLLETAPAEVRRLAAPDVLLGFLIEDALPVDEEARPAADAEEATAGDDAEPPPLVVGVALFLWPAPVTPAQVAIAPPQEPTAQPAPLALLDMDAPASLVDALAAAVGLPSASCPSVLAALALACWSAHQVDEPDGDEDDESEEDEEDEEDTVP